MQWQDELGPDKLVAALQLYSDKTLLDNKSATCHVMRAALLNVILHARHTTIK
jgi:hypothetical protein